MWTKNFIRNDPREDTPHRYQRETPLVPKGGNCALEKTHGAGKIEIEGRRFRTALRAAALTQRGLSTLLTPNPSAGAGGRS